MIIIILLFLYYEEGNTAMRNYAAKFCFLLRFASHNVLACCCISISLAAYFLCYVLDFYRNGIE